MIYSIVVGVEHIAPDIKPRLWQRISVNAERLRDTPGKQLPGCHMLGPAAFTGVHLADFIVGQQHTCTLRSDSLQTAGILAQPLQHAWIGEAHAGSESGRNWKSSIEIHRHDLPGF